MGRPSDPNGFSQNRIAELISMEQRDTPSGTLIAIGGHEDKCGGMTILRRVADGVLREEDAQEGAEPVMVLSHAFWQARFGGDPRVVGSTVRLDTDRVPEAMADGPVYRALPHVHGTDGAFAARLTRDT